MQPLENRLRSQDRADRSAWRRRARSDERWQLVLTLANCTAGEIFTALQRQTFLQPDADEELGREWDFVATLAHEPPPEDGGASQRRPQHEQSATYRDRMMRARGR